MPRLIKSVTTTYIPASPGDFGIPATVAIAGYWYTVPQMNCAIYAYSAGVVCTTTYVPIFNPPRAASPGVPYSAPTPEQIIVSLNIGWNSYASSIGKLEAGGYLKYTIKPGTTGALLAVGYAGKEGVPIGSFTHGLMTDISTINVFEGGIVVATLGANAPGTEIRIARLTDGRIVYTLSTGVQHISTAPTYLPSEVLYVYGMLYSGYDEVASAAFVPGDLLQETTATIAGVGTLTAQLVQFVEASIGGVGNLKASPFPSATIGGIGTLTALVDQTIEVTIAGVGNVWAYVDVSSTAAVTINGVGSITASPFPSVALIGAGSISAVTAAWLLAQSVTVAGRGRLTAEAYQGQLVEAAIAAVVVLRATPELGGRGYGELPIFTGLGGDTDYGQGYGVLPIFISGASNGQSDYVPPPITRGYGNLPFIVGAAYATEISIGTGSASLPIFVGVAGDYDYGFGRGDLPAFTGSGYGGFIPDDTIVLAFQVLAESTFSSQRDIVLILNSTGQLQSTLAMTRAQALELLSSLQATSTLSMLGVYGFSLLSNARGLSIQTLSINNRPDLYENGVVWVVNTSNTASSQYEQYGFNSFFTRDGKAYGVANDGIYLLEGNTDNGTMIEALAEMGRSNFGSPQMKRVTNVYLGVDSDKTMYLKVNADNQEYIYEMRNNSEDINNKRVDIGRGLKGNYWNMTLLNRDGADFKLASVVFEPIPLSRKI